MGEGGMPEARRREAVLAASSTRRTLDENIVAAAEVAYAAGRADERARVLALAESRALTTAEHALVGAIRRGEHLDD